MAPGTTRVFQFTHAGQVGDGFLIQHPSGLHAYVNRCPHFALDLDMGDGDFYAADIDRIYCKNHGALFRVSDGVCEHGPCLGRALDSFAIDVEGDDALVRLEGNS